MLSLSAVDGHRAFVRGEPKGAPVPGADTIRVFFEQYGEIHDVYVPARTPDVCYVTFKHAQSLDQVLGDCSPGGLVTIGSSKCSVQKAMPRGGSAFQKEEPSAGFGGLSFRGVEASMAHSLGVDPALLMSTGGFGGGVAGHGGGQLGSLSESSTRIYVTGSVAQLGEEALAMHFGQFGCVKDVYIPVDRLTGLKKPFAFITMGTPQEQQMVLALPTHQLSEEISVNVTYAEPRSESKGGGKGGDVFGEGGLLDGGLDEATMAALGLDASSLDTGLNFMPPRQAGKGTGGGPKQGVPGENRIFVVGMPDGLNADMLRGHFARHGEIFDIYIPPRTPDIAYITFANELQVQDALVNSGVFIAGYTVKEVKMAESRAQKGSGRGSARAGPY